MAEKWLSCDPGEDAGWAVWEGDELIDGGTTKLWQFADDVWAAEPPLDRIERMVVEDFRIYSWKVKSLAWDQVRTARLIGALTFIARTRGLDFILQPAKIKEPALAAGAGELFKAPQTENRHFNDAILHGVYWSVLNPDNPNRVTNSAPAGEGIGCRA